MSLLSQTARYLLISALAIALIGSVGFYKLIRHKIRHEVDEILTAEVKQVRQRLQYKPVAQISEWDDNPRIEHAQIPIQPEFRDMVQLDSLDNNEPIEMRQLRQTVLAKGQLYLVTVRQPYYEFNELTREMSIGVIISFLILMALSVTVGLGLARRLWRPFYATIDQLGSFQLDKTTDQPFPASRIQEFNLLSRSLGELTQKLRQQFSLQKQFTENASHELQTPLAVASAELDLLLQSEHLTENDHSHLQRATDALGRLSQLSRSLLLLTQVENDQFASDELLDLSALLTQYADEYEPFFIHKTMTVERVITPTIQLRINRQLASVLVTNLLKNAARHGCAGGSVCIVLTAGSLTICNTGESLPFPDSQLFNRFVKNPARPDSTGLGLALIKQIADRYGLQLQYAFDTTRSSHQFRLTW